MTILEGEAMLTDSKRKMLEHYDQGLKLYKAMRFEEALKWFDAALREQPEDGPTMLYISRCRELLKNPPPPDWDGVYTMTTK